MHLLVMLSAIDGQECGAFWPSGGHGAFFEVGFQKMKVSMMDEVETATWKAFRLSLEVSMEQRPRPAKFFTAPKGREGRTLAVLKPHERRGRASVSVASRNLIAPPAPAPVRSFIVIQAANFPPFCSTIRPRRTTLRRRRVGRCGSSTARRGRSSARPSPLCST